MGLEGAPSKQGIGWQGAIAKRMRRSPRKQERKKNKESKVGGGRCKVERKKYENEGCDKKLDRKHDAWK